MRASAVSGLVLGIFVAIAACSSEESTGGGDDDGGAGSNAGRGGSAAGSETSGTGGAPISGGSGGGGASGAAGVAGMAAAGKGGNSGSASGSTGDAGAAGSDCEQPCAEDCCSDGELCFQDEAFGVEVLRCATLCETSTECASVECCALLDNGQGVCSFPSETNICRCETGDDCETGACAPYANESGNPVGPYVCVPDDGQPYHGCNGTLTFCDDTSCCLGDELGNLFCARPCVDNSQCGGTTCWGYDNSSSSCASYWGCGPNED